jgi:catechol 2,3-dioxygenase-like lactoylglutathione lyase family enzyme
MKVFRAVPALPVQDVELAVVYYEERLGFSVRHKEDSFAVLERDEVELHLWAAGDQGWKERVNFVEEPVCSGAESFIAGTSSCRIEVVGVDGLYEEMARSDVLHPGDPGHAVNTDWGTREFATLDLDGNLLTFFQRQ